MTLRSLIFFIASSAFAAVDPALREVKTIYILPMSGGLDQHLANRLTKTGQYRIVTDPAVADAIFTDKIGPAFEIAYEQLYPKPKPPVEEKKDEKKESKDDVAPRQTTTVEAMASAEEEPTNRVSAFSRGKGNVFLVDRKTKQVLWSEYRLPKNSRPDELNRVADGITERLLNDIKPKK